MRMSRTQKSGLAGSSSGPDAKKSQKRQTVLRRSGLLACVCALSFITAHLIMVLTRLLPLEDARLKTDLGGMVIAALVPMLVLAGFAGRRHSWGLILGVVVCASIALASILPS